MKSKDLQRSIARLEKGGSFKDSHGNEFEMLDGYRDLIKPGWRSMLQPQPEAAAARVNIDVARKQVREMAGFLAKFGLGVEGKTILEVGCHDGKNAFVMAELGANHIDAIDIPAYGVLQARGGVPDNTELKRQSTHLTDLRAKVAHEFGRGDTANRVSFHDQDVVHMIKQEAYDLVVSWETLEHITDPRKAIANMFSALRPGGVSFHEYNPFFSIEGGHSLCTLDFPYGHARLSPTDFERYISEFRPAELDVSMNFYNHCLNRMTIEDLREYCEGAGFQTLALCSWESSEDLALVDDRTLAQCKGLKENLTINDLLSSRVWVLLQKPDH